MIEGADRVIAKLERVGPLVVEAVTQEVNAQTLQLEALIKGEYLSGQVLNRRTGALSRSVHAAPAKMTGSEIKGSVGAHLTVPKLDGTRVPLMAVHEFGAVITAKRAKYLRFKINGHWVMTKSVTIPKRPVMVPALKSRRDAIISGIEAAVRRAVHES